MQRGCGYVIMRGCDDAGIVETFHETSLRQPYNTNRPNMYEMKRLYNTYTIKRPDMYAETSLQ